MKPRPSMYSRPAKPLSVSVPRRDWHNQPTAFAPLPEPVLVHKGSECHVTPPDVADLMASHAGSLEGVDVLEPSAGTGNLARAAIAWGCSTDRLTMIEMHTGLAKGLEGIGPVTCVDFLEWATEHRGKRSFGAILMNPPFSRVKAHVAAASALLAPGGTLVALVPSTFESAGFDLVETLPPDTFALAKVHTKIVTQTRPY